MWRIMLIDLHTLYLDIIELKEYIAWRRNFYNTLQPVPKPDWIEESVDYVHGYLHELLELKLALAAPILPPPRHLFSSQSPPSASNPR